MYHFHLCLCSCINSYTISLSLSLPIQLTDFGACRSLGESSRLLVKTSQQSLGTLRNGDWKEVQSDATSQSVVNDESSLDDEDLDLR